MTDREKLYDLIVDAENEFYKNNHFAEDSKRIESVVERLIAHGVMVRQMQKPMTVEELFLLPDVVYLECSFFDDVYTALPERYDKQTIDMMMRDESCRFYLKGYGKTWRCWAEKPTDAERQAAEWEK